MNQPEIRFCPLCGNQTETRHHCRELRPTCTACGWVYFPDPKVAAAALIEQDGAALLTRRIGEPCKGMWTLPAGFVDAYEDPARAAVRECLEETGLQVEIIGLVDVIAGREHPAGADIVIVYRARVLGGTLKAGDDADRVGFFRRDQLPPLAFRATRLTLGITD